MPDLKGLFQEKGHKPFRANQVYDWIWKKGCVNFDQMSNLSKDVRQWLESDFTINAVEIESTQKSSDGTLKNAFRLFDGNKVEGVLIPTEKRMTACISIQVGCSLSCNFCATGKLKRMRNLHFDEIYDQVTIIQKQAHQTYQKQLSNIVYMGMGEPLLNYKNLLLSIDKITSSQGLGISPKRITVSTAGITKMIEKLADDNVAFNFALSLHAANDEKRNKIMAINQTNNLKNLKKSLQYFHGKTGKKITFEYIIFKDFNDTIQDAKELLTFAKGIPCKVNIIEYNAFDEGIYQKADTEKTNAFANYLSKHNLPTSIRRSRGKDIDAACGQLANHPV